MSMFQPGDKVDVDAGPNGLWEYVGTGVVKDALNYIVWVEMDNGEHRQVHIGQLRLVKRGAQ
jgi:hypothetical protein